MTGLTDTQRMAKARRAFSELAETNEAFDAVRAKIVEKLLSTAVDQQALREKLFFAAQTVDAVRKAMRAVIEDGQLIEAALGQANLFKP
jgi:hypothetical protein